VDMFSIEKFKDGEIIAQCGDAQPRFLLIKSGRALMWKHPKPDDLVKQLEKEEASKKKRATIKATHIMNRVQSHRLSSSSPASISNKSHEFPTASNYSKNGSISSSIGDGGAVSVVTPKNANASINNLTGDFDDKFNMNNIIKKSELKESGVSVLRSKRSIANITQASIDALTEFEVNRFFFYFKVFFFSIEISRDN
jgi:hypothetical protein